MMEHSQKPEIATPPSGPIRVLCLDDEPGVLKVLRRTLGMAGMQVAIFECGGLALKALDANEFEVIISDMRMPEMDGVEFLTKARQVSPQSQRILLSGYSDMDSTIAAINEGGIHNFLQKPWQNEALIHVIKDAAEKYRLKQYNLALQEEVSKQNDQLKVLNGNLEELVEKRTAQIRTVLRQLETANKREQDEHKATVELLYNFINANPYINADLAKHIAHLCGLVAHKLGLSEKVIQLTKMAGYLAQVGLLAMDPALYNQPVEQLSPQQRKLFFTHPATAQLMLMPAQHLSDVGEAIYHQYEKYNGQGIPKGLKGKEIPIGAHILAAVRDYVEHLLKTKNPEKEQRAHALEMIKMYSGSFYHPKVVAALEQSVQTDGAGTEQVGSMNIIDAQKLKPGMELGLAIHSHKGIMLLPKGHVFTAATVAKLQQLESQKPTPFRILIKT
ncbi:HD domain-containing phosphohydrolase [Pseudoalteromonas ardens]|uniref:Chemotaxis protein CheY n=1 Tax=Pseudoalteromonas rubra TaxID=43658 RepID=A0A0L0EW26_9GAMM|nr:HD domain-containing phosphohydrolase [Pseudoalteromonas sp. R96]KNC68651.1 chemotaxis protein CheY [Pseudoalteromonas rubra]MDK1310010.1 response regulator [Pseudoalteromonas sp. R96]